MTFAESIELFKDYIATERRYSSQTVTAYMTDLQQFGDYLEPYGIDDVKQIGSMEIRDWQMSLMESGDKPRSVARKLATLRSWHKYLRRMKLVSGDPFAKVSAPKLDKPLPISFRESEVEHIYELPITQESDFAEIRDKLMLCVLYETGVRRAELVGMTTGSFDHSSHTLRVLGKRDKERIIPVTSELLKAVDEYSKHRDKIANIESNALFITEKGKPVTATLVYRVVKKYMTSLSNADKISTHVFRHSFATHMLNEGADINAVKELLGHADLSATQIYAHVTKEYLKETYRHTHPRAK